MAVNVPLDKASQEWVGGDGQVEVVFVSRLATLVALGLAQRKTYMSGSGVCGEVLRMAW
jgi:hypothetical protein